MDDPVGDGRSAESFDFMDSWPEVRGEAVSTDTPRGPEWVAGHRQRTVTTPSGTGLIGIGGTHTYEPTPVGDDSREALARLLLDAEREWSLLPVEQMPKAGSLAESKALHLADVVLAARPSVPTRVDRPRWDDDLVALRAGVKRLIDNQQSWIDHGRSGQVISRDAVRDTLRTLLGESPDSSPESR